MGNFLTGLPVGSISAGALVLVICWWITRLVLKGNLVPRQQIMDLQVDRDHYRKVADDSLAMATKLGMSVEKLTMSVEKLTASAETSNHALVEIQAAVTERRT